MTQPSSLLRIDEALARIEAAVARHAMTGEALQTRHAQLQARVAEAIAALDELIGKDDG